MPAARPYRATVGDWSRNDSILGVSAVANRTSCGPPDARNRRSYALVVRRAPAMVPKSTPPTNPAMRPRKMSDRRPRRQLARPTYHAPNIGRARYCGCLFLRLRLARSIQSQRRFDIQAEAATPRFLDANRRVTLVETTLEQDEPTIEIVAEVGQFKCRVEPDFLVREIDAALALIVAE